MTEDIEHNFDENTNSDTVILDNCDNEYNNLSIFKEETMLHLSDIKPLTEEIINLNVVLSNLEDDNEEISELLSSLNKEMDYMNIDRIKTKNDVSQLIVQKLSLQLYVRSLLDENIRLKRRIKELEDRTLLEVVSSKIEKYIS